LFSSLGAFDKEKLGVGMSASLTAKNIILQSLGVPSSPSMGNGSDAWLLPGDGRVLAFVGQPPSINADNPLR